MAIPPKDLFDAVMAAPVLVSPQAAIIARQAVELEELKREFNRVVDKLEEMHRIFSQMKDVGSTYFHRFE